MSKDDDESGEFPTGAGGGHPVMGARWGGEFGGPGSGYDMQHAVTYMAYNRIPAGVSCVVILSGVGGWRWLVHRACMWVLAKTGHKVLRP